MKYVEIVIGYIYLPASCCTQLHQDRSWQSPTVQVLWIGKYKVSCHCISIPHIATSSIRGGKCWYACQDSYLIRF